MNAIIMCLLAMFPLSTEASKKLEQKNIDNRERQFLREIGIHTIGEDFNFHEVYQAPTKRFKLGGTL